MQRNPLGYSAFVVGALAMGLVSTAVTYFLRSERGKGRRGVLPNKSSATEANPSDATNAQTVFVSEHGERYHRRDCRHLRGKVREIPIEEAWETHTPCAICNPLG